MTGDTVGRVWTHGFVKVVPYNLRVFTLIPTNFNSWKQVCLSSLKIMMTVLNWNLHDGFWTTIQSVAMVVNFMKVYNLLSECLSIWNGWYADWYCYHCGKLLCAESQRLRGRQRHLVVKVQEWYTSTRRSVRLCWLGVCNNRLTGTGAFSLGEECLSGGCPVIVLHCTQFILWGMALYLHKGLPAYQVCPYYNEEDAPA